MAAELVSGIPALSVGNDGEAGSSSSTARSKGKGRATASDAAPAIEHYDITLDYTYGLEKGTALGFFAKVNFKDCYLEETRFEHCSFTEVTFDGCTFNNTTFRNVYLNNVKFVGCDFDGITWSNDSLKCVEITESTFDGLFYQKCLSGSGPPLETFDQEWLTIARILADGAYKQSDEALARDLQALEDSKQPIWDTWDETSSERRDAENMTVEELEELVKRKRKEAKRTGNRKTWTYVDGTVESGPGVGEKAHHGVEAGKVLGYDKYGFPCVEHPYFPQSAVFEEVPTITIYSGNGDETTSRSAECDGDPHSPESDEFSGGVSVASSPSPAPTVFKEMAQAPLSTFKSVNSSSLAGKVRSERPSGMAGDTRPDSAGVNSRTTRYTKENTLPHFELAFMKRRREEAAEAAEAARVRNMVANAQKPKPIMPRGPSKQELIAAQLHAEEEEKQARTLDRARVCLTLFAPAPKDTSGSLFAKTNESTIETNSRLSTDQGGKPRIGFPKVNYPYFTTEPHANEVQSDSEAAETYAEHQIDPTKWSKSILSKGSQGAVSAPRVLSQGSSNQVNGRTSMLSGRDPVTPTSLQPRSTARTTQYGLAPSASDGAARAITRESGWNIIHDDETWDSD